MTSIRNLRSRIITSEEFFNNIQVISESNTKIQQKDSNITENILSFIEFSKLIEFVYDFAIDKFENFDDDVSTNLKFQYFIRLKIYVTWQDEQRILTQIERDMIIKIAVARTNQSFIFVSAIFEKKSIIKIIKKTSQNYKNNSIYAIYDEYIMKMKQQFNLNNVVHKENMKSQRIDFASTFLNHTSKLQWHSYVRTNSTFEHIWKFYKIFLHDRITQNRLTHDQNNFDKWNDVKQQFNHNVFQFIFYLNRIKFYLSKYMKHIDFQMMSKFKNFVIVELRIEMKEKKFIKNNVIYQKLQRNIIEIEFNLNQKQKL